MIREKAMKVLFVCAANINRSQIAAAVFNRMSKKGHATSAGMKIKPSEEGSLLSKVTNNPVALMKLEGYDLSRARVKKLTPAMLRSVDKVILIRRKESLHGVMPIEFKKLPDVEWWDVFSIDEGTPFDECCRLEKRRIKRIRALVKDLVERIE